MIDVAEFLLARIAEDEAVARAAAEVEGQQKWPITTTVEYGQEMRYLLGMWLAGGTGDNILDPPTGEHIARHDPARVLAECEAKRRIVEWARYVDGGWVCDQLLPLLALPYADHPDYDEEWRP